MFRYSDQVTRLVREYIAAVDAESEARKALRAVPLYEARQYERARKQLDEAASKVTALTQKLRALDPG